MTETRSQTTQNPQAENLLDTAWGNINVLGAPDSAATTDYERGYNKAIGDALGVIEKLGGMNPDIRAASPGVQRAYWAFRTKAAILDAEKVSP